MGDLLIFSAFSRVKNVICSYACSLLIKLGLCAMCAK